MPFLRQVSSLDWAVGFEESGEARSEERIMRSIRASVLEMKTPWTALDLYSIRARASRVVRCVSIVSRM